MKLQRGPLTSNKHKVVRHDGMLQNKSIRLSIIGTQDIFTVMTHAMAIQLNYVSMYVYAD